MTYSFPPQLYGNEIPRSERIFQLLYGSLHRVVWSLALAWVIVACIRGYGGNNLGVNIIYNNLQMF